MTKCFIASGPGPLFQMSPLWRSHNLITTPIIKMQEMLVELSCLVPWQNDVLMMSHLHQSELLFALVTSL